MLRPLTLVSILAFAATAAAQQAQFLPIPGTSAQPGTNPNFCGLSGSPGWSGVRVSGDGRTVATVVYQPGFTNGAVDRRAARWTEATGTVAISPVLQGNYGVVGLSADGETVYGESWRWRRIGGYRSLLPQLTVGQFQRRVVFGCSLDGATVAAIDGIFPSDGDMLRWNIDTAPPVVVPRLPAYPNGYFYFNCVSPDGLTLGGAAKRNSNSPFLSDSFRAVVARPDGVIEIGGESEQCGVTSLSLDGSVAVGFIEEAAIVRAFRWESTTGLAYLDGTGPAGDGSYARATNLDGSVIVGDYLDFGRPRTRAFLWTEDSGLVDLREELVTRYGLDSALAGWTLLTATDVSFDGRVVVGQGVNPNGCEQAFLIRFPLVPSRTISYGNACQGTGGPLTLTTRTNAFIGQSFEVECAGASTLSLHFGVLGFAQQNVPLSSLTSLGQIGCDLLTPIAATQLMPVAAGKAAWSLFVPSDPALAGATVCQQVLQFQIANGVITSISGSNGLRSTIGSY
jgi:hypothetical protein